MTRVTMNTNVNDSQPEQGLTLTVTANMSFEPGPPPG
jgi:hypothetical protein